MSRPLDWKPAALRDLRRLPVDARERVVDSVERFAETGHGDVRRLAGVSPPELRLRVGTWRVRLAEDPEHRERLIVLRVLPRGKAYR